MVLADNALVVAIAKASLADVKPGVFVGVTGMPQADGTQRAVEVHVFSEAMRGTGEGHRPWDLQPQSTMTNGNIDQTVIGIEGQTLTLSYKGGEKKIVVPSDTPIVSIAPGEKTDRKPGAKIFIVAAKKQADGTLLAPRVNIGKQGSRRRCSVDQGPSSAGCSRLGVSLCASQAHKRLTPACTSGPNPCSGYQNPWCVMTPPRDRSTNWGLGPPGLCCLISSLAARVPLRYRCDGRTAVCQLARWTQSRCGTECRKAIWRMLWAERTDYSSGGSTEWKLGIRATWGKFASATAFTLWRV